MKKTKSNRKLVSISSSKWEPKEVGERFCGEVFAKRLQQTKFGMKVIVEIVSVESGQSIEVFASNLAMQNLARVPDGGYVELEYKGTYRAKVGGKMQDLPDIVAYVDGAVKLGDNPFAVELSADKAAREKAAANKNKKAKVKA